MRHLLTSLAILFALTNVIRAQTPPDTDNIKTQMAKLAFMSGNWQGTGWHMGPDGAKQEFDQTEEIYFDLEGTILVIKGLGKTKGKVIHDALAIVSYDNTSGKYKFKSYLSDGREGDFVAEVDGFSFKWTLYDRIRYNITISEDGIWNETGEYSINDSWNQFFEMNLKKSGE